MTFCERCKRRGWVMMSVSWKI